MKDKETSGRQVLYDPDVTQLTGSGICHNVLLLNALTPGRVNSARIILYAKATDLEAFSEPQVKMTLLHPCDAADNDFLGH